MNDSYQHPGKWQDVTLVPTMARSEGHQFVMSHIVRGLERNSVYEAIIHAKNRYGWNEVSEGILALVVPEAVVTGLRCHPRVLPLIRSWRII